MTENIALEEHDLRYLRELVHKRKIELEKRQTVAADLELPTLERVETALVTALTDQSSFFKPLWTIQRSN